MPARAQPPHTAPRGRPRPHALDRPPPEVPVDLAPEMPDEDVDDVRPVLVGEIPGVLKEVDARERLARAPHEGLQKRELLRGERDLRAASLGPPPPRGGGGGGGRARRRGGR